MPSGGSIPGETPANTWVRSPVPSAPTQAQISAATRSVAATTPTMSQTSDRP